MNRSSAIAVGLLIIGLSAFGCSQRVSRDADAGWITLFDGSNLDNWNRTGNANWTLVDGVAQADKGNGHLVSKNLMHTFKSGPSSRSMPTQTAAFSYAAPIPRRSAPQLVTR
jgi:Domain of Unknown Function (DUF1080)